MAEIHKIEKNGVTIYPATTTDAVVDVKQRKDLSSRLKSIDDTTFSIASVNLDLFEPTNSYKLTDHGFYDKQTGIFSENESFRSIQMACNEGDVFSFNGYVKYSSVAAIVLYGENDEIYVLGESFNSDTTTKNISIRIPQGITKIAFTAYTTSENGAKVISYKEKEKVLQHIDLKQFYAILDREFDYENVPMQPGFIMDDGTINTDTFPGEFEYVILDLNEGDIVHAVSETLRGSRLAGIVLFNENGDVIGTEHVGTSWATYFSYDDFFCATENVKKVGFSVTKDKGFVRKYTTLKEEIDYTSKINESISSLFDIEGLNSEQLFLNEGEYYDYRAPDEGVKSNGAFSSIKLQVKPGDMFQFDGTVAYSAMAAVIYLDANDNVLSYLYGDNNSTPVKFSTGLLTIIPNGCSSVIFEAYTNYGSNGYNLYKYEFPKVITPNNLQSHLQNNILYCNPYHYVFSENGIYDDVVNNGFDSSWNASTAGAYLIHDKVFKSYRRIINWRLKIGTGSIVRVGTTASNTDITVQSRHNQFDIDIASSKIKIYTSEGVLYSEKEINGFAPDEVYIIRLEQFDYQQKIELTNERTLEKTEWSLSATYQNSPTGKLIGRPFIQLMQGNISVLSYDTFLLYKPEIVFVGDSITECGYRQHTYAAMCIEEMFDNNGCIIAQGGANIDTLGFSLNSEIKFMKPKYLSLLAGTNGTISSENIETWRSFCEANGIIFILNRVPVTGDKAQYPWQEKNDIIRASGILGANFDYATSLGNNPDNGWDESLFGDNVHPNAGGQLKLYERFLFDVPLICK